MILARDSMIVGDLNRFEDPPMPADGETHGLCRGSDQGWRLRTGSRDDWHWKGPGCGLFGSTMNWEKAGARLPAEGAEMEGKGMDPEAGRESGLCGHPRGYFGIHRVDDPERACEKADAVMQALNALDAVMSDAGVGRRVGAPS